MNHFKNLHDKVRRCLMLEADLSEEERKLHQWQFVTTVSNITYLVGKGGANTMFYKIGNAEPKFCYPVEMLEKIAEWSKRNYVRYMIVDPNGKEHTAHRKIEALLKRVPKTYAAYSILGVSPDGTTDVLYKLVRALGTYSWKPAGPTKKTKKAKSAK